MTFQPSVAQYFNSRKRQATDEVKTKLSTPENKVLVLESSSQALSDVKTSDESQKLGDIIPSRIVYVDKIDLAKFKNRNSVKKKVIGFKPTVKASKQQKPNGIQMDIRKTFLRGTTKSEDSSGGKESEPTVEREVPFI